MSNNVTDLFPLSGGFKISWDINPALNCADVTIDNGSHKIIMTSLQALDAAALLIHIGREALIFDAEHECIPERIME
jgi:hypothetical protein